MPEPWPNMLIITGEGRNSGKTALACELIKIHKQNHSITGIKVSPHWHAISQESEVLCQNEDFIIIDEKEDQNGKDSGRMLLAGADRVFYIQTSDGHIKSTFSKLKGFLNHSDPVICESAGLLNIVRPGLHIHIRKNDSSLKNASGKMADLVLGRKDRFSNIAGKIIFSSEEGWFIS